MNVTEAYKKLIAEGANPNRIFVHSSGSADNAIGVAKKGKYWEVFYTERGYDSPSEFSSMNESEAADYFYERISKQQHFHLVGFFKSESNAKILEKEIESHGIKVIRNDIPNYKFQGDMRYRVFVLGTDIFSIRDRLGKEVKNDEGDFI